MSLVKCAVELRGAPAQSADPAERDAERTDRVPDPEEVDRAVTTTGRRLGVTGRDTGQRLGCLGSQASGQVSTQLGDGQDLAGVRW